MDFFVKYTNYFTFLILLQAENFVNTFYKKQLCVIIFYSIIKFYTLIELRNYYKVLDISCGISPTAKQSLKMPVFPIKSMFFFTFLC